ncbi:hypothetical protein COHCIP112018_04896 [Cohnella sp. JJ-181]|nr:hypothetical protein COHCIP112018_04896 [Cohnella sp. JJ-181]
MLNYLFPIFIVLLAIPIHKEKLNRYKMFSVAMGFLGSLLLLTKGDIANIKFHELQRGPLRGFGCGELGVVYELH